MNMNRDHTAGRAGEDKLQSHYQQQLSALIDGELGCDEARFMLRRLEHDPELAASQERWTLLGDVLRGQASALAPADFSQRVRQAVDDDVAAHGHSVSQAAPSTPAGATARRQGWRRWGGGAALAASVAAVAMFMGRGQLPDDAGAPQPQTVIAATAELPPAPQPAPATAPAAPASEAAAVLVAAAPAAAVAAGRRASATRTQQAARASERNAAPLQQAVASQDMTPSVPASGMRADPFGQGAAPLQAKPWPRSVVPGGGDGAFNASLRTEAPATFYPFEPRMNDAEASQRD